MKKLLILSLFASIAATPSIAVPPGDSIEANFSYRSTMNRLDNAGFVRTSSECLPTRSEEAQHCTLDFRNGDGVRLSVAVRNSFDDLPDVVYRIKCTALCHYFSWRQIR